MAGVFRDVLIVVACFAVAHLLGGYIGWDFNPAHWNMSGRYGAVALGIALSYGALAFVRLK